MKNWKSFVIICWPALICLFCSINISAQNDKEKTETLLNKMSWLTGEWKGEKWNGTIEEYWMPANGNNMTGVFRFARNGHIQFSEIMYINEYDETLSFMLKHFGNDLKGWEEKEQTIDFPLVELKNKDAIFDGLTYQLMPDGKLRVTLLIKDKQTDEIKEEEFYYSKVTSVQ